MNEHTEATQYTYHSGVDAIYDQMGVERYNNSAQVKVVERRIRVAHTHKNLDRNDAAYANNGRITKRGKGKDIV